MERKFAAVLFVHTEKLCESATQVIIHADSISVWERSFHHAVTELESSAVVNTHSTFEDIVSCQVNRKNTSIEKEEKEIPFLVV